MLALDGPLRRRWQNLSGACIHFGPGGLRDVDGAYERWFAESDVEVVLVRPDHLVFGGVDSTEEVRELLHDFISRVG
jgi:hypothetical protein